MFDDAGAASHLLSRGLIPTASGSPTRVTVRRLAGRNLLYRVEIDGDSPLLLKQAVDAETRRGLEREARAYDLIAGCRDATVPVTPRKLDYDPPSSTLVLGFLSQHRPLGRAGGAGDWNAEVADALGRMLAGLHALPLPPGDATAPWVLTLVHPPVGILREASTGQLELIGHVQGSATWGNTLESLAEEWSPRSFIHGDLRFSNILRESPPRPDGPVLALIDWELAGSGDPGWDTGWVVAEILAGRVHDLRRGLSLARAFWAGYVAGARDTGKDARLDYTLRWSAAACLQMAYEQALWPHEGTDLPDRLLEIGRSLLERPSVWIERVFTAPAR
ncbi:MAG TPA: aminoglycoside phosphotransferase family protein [Gemmatimonadota bacterium]|nr:aminoglycoside phosphotransferase family protein [Gemmatimonadota bacterium]